MIHWLVVTLLYKKFEGIGTGIGWQISVQFSWLETMLGVLVDLLTIST